MGYSVWAALTFTFLICQYYICYEGRASLRILTPLALRASASVNYLMMQLRAAVLEYMLRTEGPNDNFTLFRRVGLPLVPLWIDMCAKLNLVRVPAELGPSSEESNEQSEEVLTFQVTCSLHGQTASQPRASCWPWHLPAAWRCARASGDVEREEASAWPHSE